MKQHFGDLLLTNDEFREMLQNKSNKSYSVMMSKMQYYAKQISGTNSYWYQTKEQLKAALNQLASPTIFWTLACAESHWPEFHALFGEIKSDHDYRQNVINYPHILDWFLHERTEEFVKHWLYNTLGAGWYWYRYEFTVLHNDIHTCGLAKRKIDPGLCALSNNAIEGESIFNTAPG